MRLKHEELKEARPVNSRLVQAGVERAVRIFQFSKSPPAFRCKLSDSQKTLLCGRLRDTLFYGIYRAIFVNFIQSTDRIRLALFPT